MRLAFVIKGNGSAGGSRSGSEAIGVVSGAAGSEGGIGRKRAERVGGVALRRGEIEGGGRFRGGWVKAENGVARERNR